MWSFQWFFVLSFFLSFFIFFVVFFFVREVQFRATCIVGVIVDRCMVFSRQLFLSFADTEFPRSPLIVYVITTHANRHKWFIVRIYLWTSCRNTQWLKCTIATGMHETRGYISFIKAVNEAVILCFELTSVACHLFKNVCAYCVAAQCWLQISNAL